MFEAKGLICNDSSLTITNNPQIVKSGHEIAGPYPLSNPYEIKANIYSKFERLIKTRSEQQVLRQWQLNHPNGHRTEHLPHAKRDLNPSPQDGMSK